jgi:hypothetical protein
MTNAAKITKTDRDAFDDWARSQVALIQDTYRVNIWDYSALRAARKPIPDELAFYRGPARTVMPYVTPELRDMLAAGTVRRMTVTEWAQWAANEREAAQMAESEAQNGAHALEMLEAAREYAAKRAEWIEDARNATPPVPWAVICEASGLSRSQAGLLLSERIKDRREADENEAF